MTDRTITYIFIPRIWWSDGTTPNEILRSMESLRLVKRIGNRPVCHLFFLNGTLKHLEGCNRYAVALVSGSLAIECRQVHY